MAIVGPSLTELAEIAADLGFHFDAADIAAFRELMRGALDAYSALDRLPDALPVPRHPRLPGGVACTMLDSADAAVYPGGSIRLSMGGAGSQLPINRRKQKKWLLSQANM
jgi:hypothetical protein